MADKKGEETTKKQEQTEVKEDDNLTPSEEKIEKDEGVSAEVAHREGEFDALEAQMKELKETVSKLTESISSMQTLADKVNEAAAVYVENGAVIQDDEEEIPQPIVNTMDVYREEYPSNDEMLDLSFSENKK